MDIRLYDESFTFIKIIDVYESFIWNERYDECGDFELYMSMDTDIFNTIKIGYYIEIDKSEKSMIVENLEIETNSETGIHFKVTGRSLESILDRRIIWGQTILKDTTFQNGIETLLNDAIINPTIVERKIDNFAFVASNDDYIVLLPLEAQYAGENLYDVIVELCKGVSLGFKITFNKDDGIFEFKLYKGVNRSYQQTLVPYVIFSPKYDNIISSDYLESNNTLKNVVLVGGEGEGSDKTYVSKGTESGLTRREIYSDSSDVSRTTDEGELTDDEYIAQLEQKCNDILSENRETKTFEASVDFSTMFKLNEDFNIGDIVEITNEFGLEDYVRINEIILSHDSNGLKYYPTFISVKEEEDDEMATPIKTQLNFVAGSTTEPENCTATKIGHTLILNISAYSISNVSSDTAIADIGYTPIAKACTEFSDGKIAFVDAGDSTLYITSSIESTEGYFQLVIPVE